MKSVVTVEEAEVVRVLVPLALAVLDPVTDGVVLPVFEAEVDTELEADVVAVLVPLIDAVEVGVVLGDVTWQLMNSPASMVVMALFTFSVSKGQFADVIFPSPVHERVLETEENFAASVITLLRIATAAAQPARS